jgi:tRNA A37 threonylcarbamoyladenosine modification protein TsaB
MEECVVRLEQVRTAGARSNVLRLVERALGRKRLRPASVAGILFVNGPGGFTSLRTGLAVAQTLSFVWKRPLFSVTASSFSALGRKRLLLRKAKTVRLDYGRAPSITLRGER